MEQPKQRGGARPGSGRPTTGRSRMIGVRVSEEAFNRLNELTNNKAEFIERLIMEYKS